MTSPRIYLDHAATTPLDPAVFEAMRPHLWSQFGNPSSIHGSGRRARAAMDEARGRLAAVLGAQPAEIVFTGSGTEADNLAILGAAEARRDRGRHLIVAATEHHAVLFAARALRDRDFDLTELAVDTDGVLSPDSLRDAMRGDTVLVSVALANNEIGTIQDIAPLAAIARDAGAVFHTDAVAAAGQLDISVDRLQADLIALAAHKFYGPQGIGALYVRTGIDLAPRTFGGPQELDRRAGTENVAGIVGMSVALSRAEDARPRRTRHYARLRDALVGGVRQRVPDARLTGHPMRRLPSHASFAFPGVDAESLTINLDLEGIDVSTGSACTSGSVEPSHVIEALGLPERYVRGSLRCSVGLANTDAEIERAVEAIARHAGRLAALAGASSARGDG